MALLKNTTVTDTGNLQFIAGTTSSRPVATTTIQSYTLPYGVYFNGTSYLNTPASSALCPATSTTPFTVEAWVYLSSASTQYAVISCPTPGYNYVLALGSSLGTYDTTFKPWFGYYNGSTWLGVASSGTAIPLNSWTHLAGVFTGSSTLLFQNGVLVGGPSGGPGTWGQTGQTISVRIGSRPDGSSPNTMSGFVSNARVVIGTAVYTTGFTPSTAPLTAISGTQLLTCQSSTIIDTSSNNFSITNNSSATVVGVSAFGNTYSWTAPTGVNQVEALIVAGGGSGGNAQVNTGTPAGGGGAGGLIYNPAIPVTPGQTYTVTVGQGGAPMFITNPGQGNPGGISLFGASGNLISDPGFNSGITGWNQYNSTLTWYNSNSLRATTTAGNPAGASYTFSTIVGKTYFFKADISQSGAVTNDARVQISGVGLIRSSGQSTVAGPMTLYDYYTATSTSHILEILLYNSQAGAILTIDNVEIYNITDNQVCIGGGGGGGAYSPYQVGAFGGSGGGGCGGTGGLGFSGQGNRGGSVSIRCGGGGGAGAPGGTDGNDASGQVLAGGGYGLAFNISGSTTYYAGGGGSGASTSNTTLPGPGGQGGGASGANYNDSLGGGTGTFHTGGGGGGGAARSTSASTGGPGGSGIVVLKYNVMTDGTNPLGTTRYNSDIRGLEVYEGTTRGWVTQDPTRNFGGHNLLNYSTVSSANWTNLGHTFVQNATTAPDGTNTATQLTITASGANYVLQYATIYKTNTTYTGSVWIKNITGTGIKLTIYEDTTGTLTSLDVTNQVNTTTWTRLSISQTSSASGGTAIRFYVSGNSTGNGTSFYVWGAQFEQATTPGPFVSTNGASTPVPTSLNGYRTHTYTTVGTSGFTPAVTGLVEVLVVGGGGGGGSDIGGGGGGGGVIYTTTHGVLANQPYTVVVGVGGTAGQYPAGILATQGGYSQFGTLVALGGGTGGIYTSGRGGGSGGGGAGNGSNQIGGGFVPGQGFPGGTEGGAYASAGGGGAGGVGANGILSVSGGNGGVGVRCDISGVPTYYGGGGGSSTYNVAGTTVGTGGYGGGGAGGSNTGNPAVPAGTSGTANTGGGGGGAGVNSNAGAGGSGIVIVRYKYD